MTNYVDFGPFLGELRSVGPFILPFGCAEEALNVNTESGRIVARNGARNLDGVPAGFSNGYGLHYVSGWTSAGVFNEEYISLEMRTGVVKPYSGNVSTGARTVITDGATPLALGAGEWQAFAFADQSYHWRPGFSEGVYGHVIGNAASWSLIDAAAPTSPTVPPALSFEVTQEATVDNAGGTLDLTGLAALVDIGSAPATSVFGSLGGTTYLNVTHGISGPPYVGAYGFQMDLSTTATGIWDLSAESGLEFEILQTEAAQWQLDEGNPNMIEVRLINDDGAPITIQMEVTFVYSFGEVVFGSNYRSFKVRAMFPESATMTDWDNVKWIDIRLTDFTDITAAGPATVSLRYGEFSAFETVGDPPTTGSPDGEFKVRFGYAFYDSLRNVESESVAVTPWVEIASPKQFFSLGGDFIGNLPSISTAASSEAFVDKVSLYVQFDDDQKYRLITRADDTVLSHELNYSYDQLRAMRERAVPTTANNVGAIQFACAHKSFAVWLYDKGQANVRLSAVNRVLHLFREGTYLEDDLTRPRDMNLAGDYGDAPRWATTAGHTLVVMGQQGAYLSTGEIPATMGEFRKVPNSKGILGRAGCRWRTEEGFPSVVYLAQDQEVWMVIAGQSDQAEYGDMLMELTASCRGLVRSFLTQTDAPDVTQLSIHVDEKSDSLWVCYSNRALVLRRRSILDTKRYWHRHEYAAGLTWNRWTSCSRWGLRTFRTAGQIDEVDRNSTTGAEIGGVNRDAGAAMPTGRWRSGKMLGLRRRWFAAKVYRSPMTNPVTVKVVNNSGTVTNVLAGTKLNTRLRSVARGTEFQLQIDVSETTDVIDKVLIEEWVPAGKRRRE